MSIYIYQDVPVYCDVIKFEIIVNKLKEINNLKIDIHT